MTRRQRIAELKKFSREQDRKQALRLAIAVLQRRLKWVPTPLWSRRTSNKRIFL
jgi:hypothetical protein